MSRFVKGHIDTSTGQNKRVKVTQRDTYGGPERKNGKVVNRAQWRRDQKTGKGR
jgi:hypothetical protein